MDIFVIIQGLLISIAFLLNLSFSIVIFFNPLKSRVTSFLLCQQSIIDATLCMINILVNTIPDYHFTLNIVAYNSFVCHVWTSFWIYYHVVQMSIQNLVCIAIDRYVAVVKAMIYKEKQKHILIFSNIYVWTISLAVSFPGAMETINLNDSCRPISVLRSRPINAFLRAYAILYFILSYVLPTLFFVYVYGKIIRIMKQMKAGGNDNSMRNKFTQSAIIITCFFVLLYAYDTTHFMLGKIHTVDYSSGSILQKIGILAITMNTFVHPIVCLAMMKSIRRRYVEFYMNLFCCQFLVKRRTRKINVMQQNSSTLPYPGQ